MNILKNFLRLVVLVLLTLPWYGLRADLPATNLLGAASSAQLAPLDDRPNTLVGTLPAAGLQAASQGRRRLSPGDILDLKVYQEEELSGRLRIEPDGTITLPLLGALPVGGRTAAEAATLIRDLLAKDYLWNPHVTLFVAESAKQRFSVMGEVKLPGYYVMPENEKVNLLQALSMAGGYTAFSKGTRILIKRVVGGKEIVLHVDAQSMAKRGNARIEEILPDDAIEVRSNIL